MSIPTAGVATSPSGVAYAADETLLEMGVAGFPYAASLEGRIFVPVANTTQRNAVAAAFSPTPEKPLLVRRADAPAYARYEETTNGTTWTALLMGNSGWVAATLDGAWNQFSSISSRRIGPLVYLAGLARPDNAVPSGAAVTIGAGDTTGLICTLTADHRPSADKRLPTTKWVSGGTPAYRSDIEVEILTNGQVRLINGPTQAASGAYLDGVSFPID